MSLETATSRIGLLGIGDWRAAVLTRARTAVKFERSALARAGVAGLIVRGCGGVLVVIAGWVGWLLVLVLC